MMLVSLNCFIAVLVGILMMEEFDFVIYCGFMSCMCDLRVLSCRLCCMFILNHLYDLVSVNMS